MADASRIPESLQESILAALIFDEKWGAVIAGQVTASTFDETYSGLAGAVLAYRHKYRKAPGASHIDDLVTDQMLSDKRRAGVINDLLRGLGQLATGINGEYIASQTQEFVRRQRIKVMLEETIDRFEAGGDNVADDCESLLYKGLRAETASLDRGAHLGDPNKLGFLDGVQTLFPLDIKTLDEHNIGPVVGELDLLIGPKGTGKSWAAVHMGKQALINRKKVLHITNELYEDDTTGRYYQSLFAASTHRSRVKMTRLETDKAGRFKAVTQDLYQPEIVYSSPKARKQLKAKITSWGLRLKDVVIAGFPSGSPSVQQVESYLDYLELVERFSPEVLVVDSLNLMDWRATGEKELRHGLRAISVGLRGLAKRRKLGVFATTQGTRKTINARYVQSKDVGEDIGMVQTADRVYTLSRTEAEKEMGLARLHVAHSRKTEDKITVILAQSLDTGQFVLNSARLNDRYFAIVDAPNNSETETEEGSED